MTCRAPWLLVSALACAGPAATLHEAGGPPALVRFETAPLVQRDNDRWLAWVSVEILEDGVTLTAFTFTVFDDDGDGVYQDHERLRQAGGKGLTARSSATVAGLAVPPVDTPWIRAWVLTTRGPVEASWPVD